MTPRNLLLYLIPTAEREMSEKQWKNAIDAIEHYANYVLSTAAKNK